LTSTAEGNSDAPGNLNYNLTLYDSYIYNTFLFPVNKKEALHYLDQGGPLPQRFATVIAVRSGNNPPDVMEYKVFSSIQCCDNGTIWRVPKSILL